MSTNDVPGANARNGDVLAMGCWAESQDGSLIFVESTEGGRVIYYMFDLRNNTQYRDAMPAVSFKSTFSWKPNITASVRWTWHDKTPFPWQRVIDAGFRDGEDFPSADHLMSRAEQVRASRRRHQRARAVTDLEPEDDDDLDDGLRFEEPGYGRPSEETTAAQRVADELNLQAEPLRRRPFEDRMERTMNRLAGMMGKISSALDRLPGGRARR